MLSLTESYNKNVKFKNKREGNNLYKHATWHVSNPITSRGNTELLASRTTIDSPGAQHPFSSASPFQEALRVVI